MLRQAVISLCALLAGCTAPAGSALLTLEAAPSGQLRAIAGDRAPIGAVARFLPQNPLAELRLASGQPSVPPSTVLKAPSDPGAWSDCLVDFSDHDALALLPDAAKTTFAISPWWFQACNGVSHAVVRPIGEDHFHLGYENPHISVCEVSPNVFDYGVLADDGTCTAIDPSQEARSLYPHLGKRTTHLYVWDGLRKQPFRLNSVRVEGGVAIRLCYKPMQEPTGPWETTHPDGTTEPGIWFCWRALSTGNWDLSAWTSFVTDVKIRASDEAGIYQIDDLHLGL